ncbi:MAG: hypothetical protein P4M14_10665 [Gammaproteobacteria bacterium]|nr:hypothetical protein [Gammaproteobacteria bacterium]
MRYPITRAQLETSSNSLIMDYVTKDKFVYTAQASDIRKYPDLVVRREMNSVLWDDYTRSLHFNSKPYSSLTPEEKSHLDHELERQKENRNFISINYRSNPDFAEFDWAAWIEANRIQSLTDILNQAFPGTIDGVPYSDLILEHQSQAPQGPTVMPAYAWAIPGQLSVLEDEQGSRFANMYSSNENGQQKVHYERVCERFTITCDRTGRQVTIRGGHLQHELTRNGYAYDENKSVAFGLDYHRIMMGSILPRLDALLSYPLNYRLQDAYNAVFRDNAEAPNNKMTLRKILGWPIKLVAEFIPSAIGQTARWARDQILENFPDKYAISQPLLRYPVQLLAGTAIILLGVIEGVGKLTNLMLARITSPLKSYEQAKAIHPALGVVSALFSIAATIALGIVLSPLLPALGLGSTAAWVVAHTGAVGQFFTVLGAKLTSAVGISVLPSAAAITTMAASLYAIFLTPIRYIANRLANPKPEANAAAPAVIANEVRPNLSDSFIREHLQASQENAPAPRLDKSKNVEHKVRDTPPEMNNIPFNQHVHIEEVEPETGAQPVSTYVSPSNRQV